MKVLLVVESKHGATEEIAAAIAAELQEGGAEVDSRHPGEVDSLDGYEAVVLGSAIYMGNWMPAVKHFIDRHRDALKQRRVWLFSSGPIGDAEGEDPVGDKLEAQVGAVGHAIFSGKLDRSRLGIAEKLVTGVVHAPEGDFRDWEAIRAWARGIALQLKAPAPSR